MTTHEHHHLEASWAMALSATLHCLTGCAIGEVLGMIIGSALGWSAGATVALSIALAFLFGYSLTSLPLLRSGMALAAVIPIALATDTVSIAIMEVVDNTIMVAIPGAMEAGLDEIGFYAALTAALIIAGAAALPVNRWLIARGKGHAVLHTATRTSAASAAGTPRSTAWPSRSQYSKPPIISLTGRPSAASSRAAFVAPLHAGPQQ